MNNPRQQSTTPSTCLCSHIRASDLILVGFTKTFERYQQSVLIHIIVLNNPLHHSSILVILSVHVSSWKLSSAADIEGNRMIDDIIEKLLRSEKFDQLASKIAERAAERIIQIRDANVTGNTTKGDPIYRVANNISGSKHLPDLNVEREDTSSLIARLLYPFANLTLKYATLIEKEPDDNRNVQHGVRSKKMSKQRAKNSDKKTHDSYTKGYSEDTDKRKKETKLRNADKVSRSKENDQTTTKNNIEESSDDNYPSDNSFEGSGSFPNTTVMLTSIEKDYTQTSMEIIEKQIKNHSQVNIEYKNGDRNSSDFKTKRILGMENQRLYVVASSSEYQDYREDFFQ